MKNLTVQEKVNVVYDGLDELFHGRSCELDFTTNFELLVAVILSAQCTDKRVNQVTAELFKEYNTPEKIANMPVSELEKKIYSCGFYRNKAQNIISCAKDLIARFGGQVPSNFEDLVSLAGVGRKTANVVMAVGFRQPAFAVDTHVFRVSNRLGLVDTKSVEECEKLMKQNTDKDKWIDLHHYLVLFGRYYCKAIKPECEGCRFAGICEFLNRRK